LRRAGGFDTMTAMIKSWTLRLLGVAILAACSGGCVSATEHREALADLQRLRMEAWQRSVEASSLRLALDRAAAENAQLRVPQAQIDQGQTLMALAAKLDEIARRQEIIEDELKTSSQCAQPAGTVLPATANGQAVQPRGRKVTDLLYSRF
jgi:hypothetical protein